MMSQDNLYVLRQKWLWGDYGFALISGYADRKGHKGLLHLRRAGPFLPPISFPLLSTEGRLPVVSDGFCVGLERAGFGDLVFRPVVFDHIVDISWHLWDLAAECQEYYPPDPCPTSYVDGLDDDKSVREAMKPAYEVLPPLIETKITQMQDPPGSFINHFIMQRS
jgi:hypothetical protein